MILDTAPRAATNRRQFIKLGAAASGTLLVGFRLAEAASPPRMDAQAGAFIPNAFLEIDRAGTVTLLLPKSEMGQSVYTAIGMLVAEELDIEPRQLKVIIPTGESGRFGKVSQGTGGSNAIRQTFLPVRQAAATARAALVTAAAKRWSVGTDSCRTEAGWVHAASGSKLPYGELVPAAMKLPLTQDPPLKNPQSYRVIGKPVRRFDSIPKTRGETIYGIDVRIPGMLVAAVQLPPAIGDRINSIDDSAARTIAGIAAVLDLGDAVVVAASNYWSAAKGLQALKIDWQAGPNRDLQQANIRADILAALEQPGAVAVEVGDLTAAQSRAVKQVSALYEQPFLAHATMEGANCTVHVTDKFCNVWVGTQVPHEAKNVAQRTTGLPAQAVTVYNHSIGGGFGRRLETDMIELAVRAGMKLGKPLKVIWNRQADIQQDRVRPYYCDRLSAGLDAEGRPIAWSHRIAGSSIIARLYPKSFKGVDGDAVEGSASTPYDLANKRVEFCRQESPVITSWWRGVGALRSNFVVESFIDELAHASGADPIAYRRALLTDERLKSVLDRVRKESGWDSSLAPGSGRGVSLMQAFGTYMAQVAEVTVGKSGEVRVQRVTVAVDCGQPINPLGIEAQIQGGVVFGASAALFGEVTVANGRFQQSNFHDYRVLRMNDAPVVEVHIIDSHEPPGGMGEPPTVGSAAAIANAVFAASGRRIRVLPIARALAAQPA